MLFYLNLNRLGKAVYNRGHSINTGHDSGISAETRASLGSRFHIHGNSGTEKGEKGCLTDTDTKVVKGTTGKNGGNRKCIQDRYN